MTKFVLFVKLSRNAIKCTKTLFFQAIYCKKNDNDEQYNRECTERHHQPPSGANCFLCPLRDHISFGTVREYSGLLHCLFE